jgi:hypothetical protein
MTFSSVLLPQPLPLQSLWRVRPGRRSWPCSGHPACTLAAWSPPLVARTVGRIGAERCVAWRPGVRIINRFQQLCPIVPHAVDGAADRPKPHHASAGRAQQLRWRALGLAKPDRPARRFVEVDDAAVSLSGPPAGFIPWRQRGVSELGHPLSAGCHQRRAARYSGPTFDTTPFRDKAVERQCGKQPRQYRPPLFEQVVALAWPLL